MKTKEKVVFVGLTRPRPHWRFRLQVMAGTVRSGTGGQFLRPLFP